MTGDGTPQQPAPQFKRVLIVDDEEAVVRTLSRAIERSGREVVCAHTVDEGLAKLNNAHVVDLVITDVHLGGGSGVEIARAAARMLPAPPVIAITGLASAAEGLQLGKAGVSVLMAKPFTGAQLIDAIEGISAPKELELDAVIRRSVGARPMREVLDAVRRSMVLEALARTNNNKAQAAALLGISRQHLQMILSRGQV